jgi:hypothetical protein
MFCSRGPVPAPLGATFRFGLGLWSSGRLPIRSQIWISSLAVGSMNWKGFGPTFLRSVAGNL